MSAALNPEVPTQKNKTVGELSEYKLSKKNSLSRTKP
jgi:hypothetical protein